MKKTIKFFAAALAIVAAASCAKENQNISDQELVYKVFSATFDADTKTTLHTDGLTVHWTEGDIIKVFPSNSAKVSDFSIRSCSETFADFEGETVDANSYRAVYPATSLLTKSLSGWLTEDDYYIFADYSSKCALAHQHAVENNFSTIKELGTSSNFALSNSSENGHLYFKNINAFLKVRLAMDNAASIEVSASKVMNQSSAGQQGLSESAKLGGPITIDFAHSNKMGILANNGEDISFKKADGNNLLPDVNYYIAIPAVKMEGLKLVVKDANGKVLQTLTKSSTFTAEANKIYNLGTIEAAPIPVPKVGDYFYADGTFSTNLDNSRTVVGVIFYTGDPTEKDEALKSDYPNCTNGLVVAIKPHNTVWHSSKLISSNYSSPLKFNYVPSASNWTWGGYTIKSMWKAQYTNLTLYSNCGAGPDGTSEWYIPTPIEWGFCAENISTVNEKIKSANGTQIETTTNQQYWMPFLHASSARTFYFSGDSLTYYTISTYNTTYKNVYPIFAF